MNQYFLLIACLQLWSLITPVNPASTWGPLIFIFAVSASKEAWDDYHRYLSDKKANEKEVWIVKQGIKKHIQAQDIQVGNIVWLRENDEVPCDLVLLGTSDPQGVCYVETAALDGETDLKTRVIPSACVGIDLELLHKMKGVIECPVPDKDIRRFDANMRLFPPFIDNDVCSLTIKNTLLQSCYLRNTEWACGVSVYTGNQTKLGMSRGIAEPKLTAMDAMIDKLTGAIFVFQIVVVLVLGIAGNVWKDTEARKQWYVQYPEEAPWYELLVIPLRFELLCSIMIPISIKVV
jgi:phospholipid-translocating ATPase